MQQHQPPIVTHGDELYNSRKERRETLRPENIVQSTAEKADEILLRSVFRAPHLYLSTFEAMYRMRHKECLVREQHDCLVDKNCFHRPLPVVIYRRMSSFSNPVVCKECESDARRKPGAKCTHVLFTAPETHICIPEQCIHCTSNHICRLDRCWHSRSAEYPEEDTRTVDCLYICSKTGRVHACGDRCNNKHPIVRNGLFICPLTGIITGREYVHALGFSDDSGMAEPVGYEAIDYMKAAELDFDAEEEIEIQADSRLLSSGLTPRTANLSLLEAPPAPTKWTPSITAGQLEELRKQRRKAVLSEMQRFMAGYGSEAGGVIDTALKPIRDAIKTGATKKWPGTIKMMCRIAEASPKPFHPSWRGWRLDRTCVASDAEKRIWKLMGFDAPRKTECHENDETIDAAVILYERLEKLEETNRVKFETAVPGLLKILDSGILSETGVAVKQRPMPWYSSRRSELLYAQWSEVIKKTFVTGEFGGCV